MTWQYNVMLSNITQYYIINTTVILYEIKNIATNNCAKLKTWRPNPVQN